jgi:DNA-directed RNA polymerase specialized sigma24 family protein/LysM repeat protein
MLDLTPQYAPDLEWMLQSGQVPRELLLEALLQEYYTPVYHLALSILDDHAAAQSTARQTFARALLDQHRYRSQDGVDFWLFRIALEACQQLQKRLQLRRSLKALLPRWSKPNDFGDSCPDTLQDAQLWLALDGLEHHTRQLALLYFANGWQPERIAALFEVAESEVAAVLGAARQLVAAPPQLDAASADAELPSENPLPPEQIDPCLIQSLQRRWPAREHPPAELQTQSAHILHRLRWLGFRQTKALAALELGLLVLIILLAFAAVWGANALSGERPTATPEAPLATHLVTKVIYKVVTSTPYPEQSPEQSVTPIQVAPNNYTEVRPGETLQDVANRLGITVADLRYWNRLPDYVEIQAGERLINPQYARSLKPSAATTVSPVEPLPTLEATITTQQFIDLLNQKNQQLKSYWFDASIIDYGPQSYIGPAHLTHVQAWASENQRLILAGDYGALPEESILMAGDGEGYLAKPSSDTLWFSEWRKLGDLTSPTMISINQLGEALFNPGSLSSGSIIQVIGREEIADRSTIEIVLFNSDGIIASRLWVDDSLGQIMRRINYRAGDVPAMEYRLNTLDPNVDFPQDLFDLRLPWRGGFARDFRGAPLAPDAPPPQVSPARPTLTAQPPPAGFDLSHSQMIFQYSGSAASFSPEAQFEVFADSYFLGQAFLGDPWNLICDRSPDGRWFAYASRPAQSHDPGSLLHWFDLSQPTKRYFTLYNQTGITELAFSPDSRRLAYFSQPNPLIPGTLSTLDLPFQNVRQIYTTGDLKSLVWSPDGQYLAFINRSNPASYQENILVISTSDGSVSYNAPLDVLNKPIKDWPMATWGVDFPVEMGGMDACAAPPEP